MFDAATIGAPEASVTVLARVSRDMEHGISGDPSPSQRLVTSGLCLPSLCEAPDSLDLPHESAFALLSCRI